MTPDQEITETFVHELRHHLEGEAYFDDFNRALYSTDASIYQIEPLGVVLPRSCDDVAATVTLAAEYGLPVLPRGGGTSQAGQTVGAAIVIDFSRHLDQILELNTEERWARVQPGVVYSALTARLVPFGLQFGPDPSSGDRACFGGMLGNNASGAHSLLYGMTVDHVQAVDCVLADGSTARFEALTAAQLAQKRRQNDLEGAIYRRTQEILEQYADEIARDYPHHWRRASGYNLDRLARPAPLNLSGLVTSSEGTLVAATEMKVGLVPRPAHTGLLVVHFDRLLDALHATPLILETDPSAVELMGPYASST